MSERAEDALRDAEYWESMAPAGFYLIGFTYRDSALFGTPWKGSIEVTRQHIEFFRPGWTDLKREKPAQEHF